MESTEQLTALYFAITLTRTTSSGGLMALPTNGSLLMSWRKTVQTWWPSSEPRSHLTHLALFRTVYRSRHLQPCNHLL